MSPCVAFSRTLSLALVFCWLSPAVSEHADNGNRARNNDVPVKDVVHIVFSNHLVRTLSWRDLADLELVQSWRFRIDPVQGQTSDLSFHTSIGL
jgi:hypothetical protein